MEQESSSVVEQTLVPRAVKKTLGSLPANTEIYDAAEIDSLIDLEQVGELSDWEFTPKTIDWTGDGTQVYPIEMRQVSDTEECWGPFINRGTESDPIIVDLCPAAGDLNATRIEWKSNEFTFDSNGLVATRRPRAYILPNQPQKELQPAGEYLPKSALDELEEALDEVLLSTGDSAFGKDFSSRILRRVSFTRFSRKRTQRAKSSSRSTRKGASSRRIRLDFRMVFSLETPTRDCITRSSPRKISTERLRWELSKTEWSGDAWKSLNFSHGFKGCQQQVH